MTTHHIADKVAIWWLYVLECNGGSLYTGIAVDVARRYVQHCRGIGATYTRIRPPMRLIGTMCADTRSAALKLEYAFKRLPAREKLARATAMGVPASIASRIETATTVGENGGARRCARRSGSDTMPIAQRRGRIS